MQGFALTGEDLTSRSARVVHWVNRSPAISSDFEDTMAKTLSLPWRGA